MQVSFSVFGEQLTGGRAGILQLMEDLGRALSQPGPVYMLGGGNPAKIPAVTARFLQALRTIAEDEDRFQRIFTDYAEPQGLTEFRRDLAHLFRTRYGWPIGLENIVLTNGSQQAFAFLFNMIAGPMPDGSFRRILFPMLPEYIGYTDTGFVPGLFRGLKPEIEAQGSPFYKYRVDLAGLPEDTRDLAAVCVSRPTNPTGNVLTQEEVEALARWTREKGLLFIVDGAYGAPFPYILFTDAEPYWDEHMVLGFSLSKLGLPGVRMGIFIAAEPIARGLAAMNAILALAPNNAGAAFVWDMVRSGEILDIGPRTIRPFYQQKRDQALTWLETFLRGVPYRVHQPEGTFFLWLWFPGLPIPSYELYQRLKERHVLVVPGEPFFPGLQEAWPHRHECIRINVAGPEEMVKEGLRRLGETVREIYERGA